MENKLTDAEQLQEWQEMWNKAQPTVSKEPPLPKKNTRLEYAPSEEYLEQQEAVFTSQKAGREPDLEIGEIFELAQNVDKVFKNRELNEDKDVSNVYQQLANSPNPTYPDSHGKDQDNIVVPNINDGKALRELDELKRRVELVERDAWKATIEPNEKQETALQKEIDSLRERIEKLSQDLSPRIFDR